MGRIWLSLATAAANLTTAESPNRSSVFCFTCLHSSTQMTVGGGLARYSLDMQLTADVVTSSLEDSEEACRQELLASTALAYSYFDARRCELGIL